MTKVGKLENCAFSRCRVILFSALSSRGTVYAAGKVSWQNRKGMSPICQRPYHTVICFHTVARSPEIHVPSLTSDRFVSRTCCLDIPFPSGVHAFYCRHSRLNLLLCGNTTHLIYFHLLTPLCWVVGPYSHFTASAHQFVRLDPRMPGTRYLSDLKEHIHSSRTEEMTRRHRLFN